MNNLYKCICINGLIFNMFIQVLKIRIKHRKNKILMTILISQIVAMTRAHIQVIMQVMMK